MPTAMMITNRNVLGNQLGDERDTLRYYISDKASLDTLSNCTELVRDEAQDLHPFRDKLIEIAGSFPPIDESENEKQKHVSFFIHGYNNTWTEGVTRYRKLQTALYADQTGLG